MIVASTTAETVRPPAENKAENDSKRIAAEVGGFASLLSIAQAIAAGPVSGNGKPQEMQMFEPGGDREGTNGSASKGEQEPTRSERWAAEIDERASVTARRSSQAGGRQGSENLTKSEPSTAGREGTNDRSEKNSAPRGSIGATQKPSGQGVSGPITDPAGSEIRTASKSVLNSSANQSAGGESSVNRGIASAVSSANQVVSAAPSTAGSDASPAKQIAQVLSQARLGEAESARAVAPTGGAQGNRADASNLERSTAGRPGPKGNLHGGQQAKGSSETERTSFDRLVRSLQLKHGARNSSARMLLNPPELGKLTVNVRMSGGAIEIAVRTESSETRDLLYERAGELRNSLEQYGVRIDKFEVVADADTTRDGESSAASTAGGDQGMSDARSSQQDTSLGERIGQGSAEGEDVAEGQGVVETTGEGEEEILSGAETRLDIRI